MSANPFKERAAEFMEARRGCITEISWKNLNRRLNRIEHDLTRLKEDKKVSTMSPAKLTVADVKNFIVFRKEKKVSASDVNHDISALKQLCTFCGNTAVQNCIDSNIGLKPKTMQHARLEPLPESVYRQILERYNTLDHTDFKTIRPYCLVLLYVGTGARNKELRFADVNDVDLAEWTIHLEHVKGEGSYGQPRDVPIPDELQQMVRDYLRGRELWLIRHGADPVSIRPLFCNLNGDHGYLSGNTIRKIKSQIEKDIGRKFALLDCRRAFGQHYKDNDVELEDVSKLMGHGSTRTTELYYCGKRQSEVIKSVRGKW